MKGSFGSKIKRYAQVSGAVGGILTKLVGDKYLGLNLDHDKNAEDIKKSLGNLKGPLMKIAQILATVPDMLPPNYVEALQELQSNAPPMNSRFVKRRMKAELGEEWKKQFRSFDLEACAAASLGQVHKAVSLDSDLLACKLQYPDMRSAVEADLGQLSFVLNMYEKYSGALDTENLRQEIADRLYEELDYRREAQHMKYFQQMLKDLPFAHVPRSYPDLSTDRLLTMTWLKGQKMKTICGEESQELHNQIAERMFRIWFTPLYHYGIIHGDPHLGNYTVTQNGHINLLDFGCIRVFSPSFVHGVIELYRALENDDKERLVHAYENWGFENLNNEIIDALTLWARYLFGPILDDRIRPIDENFSGVQGREVAGEIVEKLSRLGGVKPPREFVFMDRAAVGLGSVFMHLRAELNWHRLFNELIEDFDIKTVADRQRKLIEG